MCICFEKKNHYIGYTIVITYRYRFIIYFYIQHIAYEFIYTTGTHVMCKMYNEFGKI